MHLAAITPDHGVAQGNADLSVVAGAAPVKNWYWMTNDSVDVTDCVWLWPSAAATTDITGKLKEPLLRLVQFWRAYDAAARNGNYHFTDSDRVG